MHEVTVKTISDGGQSIAVVDEYSDIRNWLDLFYGSELPPLPKLEGPEPYKRRPKKLNKHKGRKPLHSKEDSDNYE